MPLRGHVSPYVTVRYAKSVKCMPQQNAMALFTEPSLHKCHKGTNDSWVLWLLWQIVFFRSGHSDIFVVFFQFIRVILVNKIIYVSSVQFYGISSGYCTVCLPPEVKFSATMYLISPPHPLQPFFSLPPKTMFSLTCSCRMFPLFIQAVESMFPPLKTGRDV